MKRTTLSWFALGLGLLLVCPAFAAEEGSQAPRPRSFSRFGLDPGTVDGLYIEAGVTQFQERTRDRAQVIRDTFTEITPFLRVSAGGGDIFEGGVLVPYLLLDEESEMDQVDVFEDSERGIGDIRAYGKVVPIRTEMFDLGGGLDVGFPTGDEDELLGSSRRAARASGEVEFLPYATGAIRSGSLEMQVHAGYLWPIDETSTAFKGAVYGGGFFYIYHEMLTFRAEFVGESPSLPGKDVDIITFEPGFDLHIAIQGIDFMIRPVGAIGMNEESPDWGIGGSIAVNLTPTNLGY